MPEQPGSGSASNEDRRADDYEFTYQDDGTVTAKQLGTGIVATGTSYAEALVDLTDALSDDEHDVEPVEDPAAFLAELDLPRHDDRGDE